MDTPNETILTQNPAQETPKPRAETSLASILVIIIFIGLGITISSYYAVTMFSSGDTSNSYETLSPVVQTAGQTYAGTSGQPSPSILGTATTVLPTTEVDNTGLKTAVTNALTDKTGTYGIVVRNLETNETYMLNENKVFNTASLYKLWVMALTIEQIQTGKLHDTPIIDQALTQMITISDNTAALLLTNKITRAALAAFLTNNALTHSSIWTDTVLPRTTALDIATFFEKLYTGGLANQQGTNRMMDLLQLQRINGKIPEYLPKDIIIAHKTGDLDSVSHDAGIVYTSHDDYLIVLLSDSAHPDKASEQIATISGAVYSYFTKTSR